MYARILLVIFFMLSASNILIAKTLYKTDFSNWRSEATDPGFNANLRIEGKKARKIAIINTAAGASYGKVMSEEKAISLQVNQKLELSLELLNNIPKGDIKVNLMTAQEPYDSHEIISAKTKKGIYKVKLYSKVPWSGKHKFWIEIWIEGEKKVAEIANVKITDGKAEDPLEKIREKKSSLAIKSEAEISN